MGDVAATVVAGWLLDASEIKALIYAKAKALLVVETSPLFETIESKNDVSQQQHGGGGGAGAGIALTGTSKSHEHETTNKDAAAAATAALSAMVTDQDLDIYGLDSLADTLGIPFHVVPMNGTKGELFVLGWRREDTCSFCELPLAAFAATSTKAQQLATFFGLDLEAAAVHLTYSSKYDNDD